MKDDMGRCPTRIEIELIFNLQRQCKSRQRKFGMPHLPIINPDFIRVRVPEPCFEKAIIRKRGAPALVRDLVRDMGSTTVKSGSFYQGMLFPSLYSLGPKHHRKNVNPTPVRQYEHIIGLDTYGALEKAVHEINAAIGGNLSVEGMARTLLRLYRKSTVKRLFVETGRKGGRTMLVNPPRDRHRLSIHDLRVPTETLFQKKQLFTRHVSENMSKMRLLNAIGLMNWKPVVQNKITRNQLQGSFRGTAWRKMSKKEKKKLDT